jgi:hypothetical protein
MGWYLERAIKFPVILAIVGACSVQTAYAQTDSLWTPSIVPTNVDQPDNNSVELGVKFFSDVAGSVHAIRFYKGPLNTGRHTVHLWSPTGTALASATSTNETASGWQTVNLSTPITITAGQTYTASYHTPGEYADDINYFTNEYSNGVLHAPVNAGVYKYSRKSAFPSSVLESSNYWVDIIFVPTNQQPPPPPLSNGECGSADLVPVSSAPTTGLCSAGTATPVSGSGPWTWMCTGSNGGTTASCSAPVQSGGSGTGNNPAYAAWPNFPQSAGFFPLVLWEENPSRVMSNGLTDAQGMAAVKMNIMNSIDNGGGGNWPTSFGVDTNGLFGDLVANKIYLIASVDTTGNTSVHSVASVQAAAGSASNYLIGYNLGDEPQSNCSTVATVPSVVSLVSSFDSTRPLFWNNTDWVFEHGVCNGNVAALQAISVGSFDLYPLTSPWNGNSGIPEVPGEPLDSMWIQGYSVAQFVANGRAGQPIWAYVETGTNELGYSAQNGNTCNSSTNLCSPNNNEYRATAEQVNAEAWMSLINGAVGIEWFCDDTKAYDFCLGNGAGGDAAVAASIAANLTYIDTTILSFAQQLNSPLVGICTMNNGTGYTNYTTSCSNGILTMSTGTSTVPGSAMVRNYNGTLYLFADSDRNGSALMTFTLSGYASKTATVVYDSNTQYAPAFSSAGQTFLLSSTAQFSDTLGANAHNYQVKIYSIH